MSEPRANQETRLDAPSNETELSPATTRFVVGIRERVARELKLTFTLPRLFDGVTADIAMKTAGFGYAALGTKVAYDQPDNPLLHTAAERVITTGVASGMALAGLALVGYANHRHAKMDREAIEYDATQVAPSSK